MSLTIWISGISASGKTTMGSMLSDNLKSIGYSDTMFLDGDVLRERLQREYGHSIVERYEILKEYIKVINIEMSQDKIVIVSTISHKKDMREFARKNIENFFEVILRCSPNTCANRDYKGQYKKALSGKYDCFPGVTEEYEMSDNPDLILDTQNNGIEKSFDILFMKVKERLNDEHRIINSFNKSN